ncbi:MAG: radical SAM protein, partial [Firmicutes bacterium]|nr:radical SAM protein [Bacillota bacterium]
MEVVDSIRAIQKLSGVSLAGGEPFCQAEACSSLAHVLRLDKYTVWCFTGFDLSHLIEVSKFNRPVRNLLQCIDVLVCGIFDSEKKVNNVGFDFSVNQKVYKIKKGKVTSELTNADLIAMQLKSSKRKKSSKLVADELVVDNTSAVVDDTPLTAASC